MVLQETGSSSALEALPLPEDDPKVRKPDITRASTILQWGPTVSLEEGLGKTIDYFRTKLAVR